MSFFRRGMTREEQREGLRLIHYGGWMEEGGMSANGTPWMAECETLDDTPAVEFEDRFTRETIASFVGPHPSQDRWLPDSSGPSWGRRVARNIFGRSA